jgi:hypothetical protein
VLLDVGIDDGDEAQSRAAAEHGERRAGVARGRLETVVVRRTAPLRIVAQHVVGGPVLEAADDAVVLELGEELERRCARRTTG